MYGHTHVDGGTVRFGQIGQMALSLLHTYIVTKDRSYLNKATDLFDPLTAEKNTLGLWDKKNLGYFGGVVFPGTDAQSPGEPRVLDRRRNPAGSATCCRHSRSPTG